MVLFVAETILQLSIASALFLIISNTLPFQVGLWDALANSVTFLRLWLILQPVYMVLSCVVGGMRLVRTKTFLLYLLPIK
jgi:hypothetical protein